MRAALKRAPLREKGTVPNPRSHCNVLKRMCTALTRESHVENGSPSTNEILKRMSNFEHHPPPNP
eukprot:8195474-Pyramimonas_sp.AAC.1